MIPWGEVSDETWRPVVIAGFAWAVVVSIGMTPLGTKA